jgi:hypothetical protein
MNGKYQKNGGRSAAEVVHDFVDQDHARFAFELGGAHGSGAEAILHLVVDGLGDEDLVGLGDAAYARRDVHGVADGGVFHARRGADAAHHRVPGIDADADLEFRDAFGNQFRQHLAQPGFHLQGGLHGHVLVVLDRDRSVEEHHHAVADELVQGAAVGEHDGAHLGEVAVQQLRDSERRQGLGEGREPADVREQYGEVGFLGLQVEVAVAALGDDLLRDVGRAEALEMVADERFRLQLLVKLHVFDGHAGDAGDVHGQVQIVAVELGPALLVVQVDDAVDLAFRMDGRAQGGLDAELEDAQALVLFSALVAVEDEAGLLLDHRGHQGAAVQLVFQVLLALAALVGDMGVDVVVVGRVGDQDVAGVAIDGLEQQGHGAIQQVVHGQGGAHRFDHAVDHLHALGEVLQAGLCRIGIGLSADLLFLDDVEVEVRVVQGQAGCRPDGAEVRGRRGLLAPGRGSRSRAQIHGRSALEPHLGVAHEDGGPLGPLALAQALVVEVDAVGGVLVDEFDLPAGHEDDGVLGRDAGIGNFDVATLVTAQDVGAFLEGKAVRLEVRRAADDFDQWHS